MKLLRRGLLLMFMLLIVVMVKLSKVRMKEFETKMLSADWIRAMSDTSERTGRDAQLIDLTEVSLSNAQSDNEVKLNIVNFPVMVVRSAMWNVFTIAASEIIKSPSISSMVSILKISLASGAIVTSPVNLVHWARAVASAVLWIVVAVCEQAELLVGVPDEDCATAAPMTARTGRRVFANIFLIRSMVESYIFRQVVD